MSRYLVYMYSAGALIELGFGVWELLGTTQVGAGGTAVGLGIALSGLAYSSALSHSQSQVAYNDALCHQSQYRDLKIAILELERTILNGERARLEEKLGRMKALADAAGQYAVERTPKVSSESPFKTWCGVFIGWWQRFAQLRVRRP